MFAFFLWPHIAAPVLLTARKCGDACELSALVPLVSRTIPDNFPGAKDADYWKMVDKAKPYFTCEYKQLAAKPIKAYDPDGELDRRFQEAYDLCTTMRPAADNAYAQFVKLRNPDVSPENVTLLARAHRASNAVVWVQSAFEKAGERDRFEDYMKGLLTSALAQQP